MKYRTQSRGVAVLELAICLPILLTLTFATIEVCTMLHLRQKIKVAAYEGARVGITPESTSSKVSYHCETLLDSQSVYGYTISMQPSNPKDLQEGDYFRVTVDAAFAPNSLVGDWIYSSKTLSETVSLKAE
ncbi:TadE-like protein [Novipirellula aureliae]|uniref:TadE-like protein n=1 Tax=Novipirellula aureliae TaxID=2527966 RepID=A0A5C6EA46_9BACT|nr:TadE family protein [Novipirellula aureliae]TWU44029.1 TadE-like protein [Novipirellula aureliae]